MAVTRSKPKMQMKLKLKRVYAPQIAASRSPQRKTLCANGRAGALNVALEKKLQRSVSRRIGFGMERLTAGEIMLFQAVDLIDVDCELVDTRKTCVDVASAAYRRTRVGYFWGPVEGGASPKRNSAFRHA